MLGGSVSVAAAVEATLTFSEPTVTLIGFNGQQNATIFFGDGEFRAEAFRLNGVGSFSHSCTEPVPGCGNIIEQNPNQAVRLALHHLTGFESPARTGGHLPWSR